MAHGISVMISVTLLVSFFRRGDSDGSYVTDSDEDKALKDALLLVDILKSAYVKVLKENNDLRSGSDTTVELSTCPTTNFTTSIRNVSSSFSISQTTKLDTPRYATIEKRPYNWSPPPFYRSNPRNNRRLTPRYYRRFLNMPLDYYYYDIDKFRRFNYEDPFGGHPNETVIKGDVISPEISSAITREAKTDRTSTTSVLVESTAVSSQTKSIKISKPNIFNRGSEHNQKLKLMLPIPSGDITTADPVISQVASELINEFGSGRSSFRPKHLNIKSSNKKIKLGENNGWWHLNPPRTTLRIHLSRSTKFPIPYPDNHAFCYTNPENALCRTLIK